MGVREEKRIDLAQLKRRKPLDCRRLESLAAVDENRSAESLERYIRYDILKRAHLGAPSGPGIRIIADVFRRIFFFPAGVSVLKHVLHSGSSGGAVMQEMSGMLPDVPVPRNMSSVSLSVVGCASGGEAMMTVRRSNFQMQH